MWAAVAMASWLAPRNRNLHLEAGNGGVGHGAHGAGTVEDECDFCFHGGGVELDVIG
jgi:hypothetical protein